MKYLMTIAISLFVSNALACINPDAYCPMWDKNPFGGFGGGSSQQQEEQELIVPAKVKCTIEKVGTNSKRVATIKAADGEEKRSGELKIQDHTYTFTVSYYENSASTHSVEVIIDNENDQVASIDCEIPLNKVVRGRICEDEMTDSETDEVLMKNYCVVEY